MDINTLTPDLALALAADSAIESWVQANYDKSFKLFVNIDPRDPPGESDRPFILFYPTAKKVGSMRDEKPHIYQIEVVLHNEEMVDPQRRANLVEYIGVAHVEALRKLVETALVAALPGSLDLDEIEIEYDTLNDFPFFFAGMTLTFNESVCIGGDYLD